MILISKLRVLYPKEEISINYFAEPFVNKPTKCVLRIGDLLLTIFSSEEEMYRFVEDLWQHHFKRDESKDSSLIVGELYSEDITNNPDFKL